MGNQIKNVIFSLEDVRGKKVYEREYELIDYYEKIMQNKEVNFYYHLKDSAIHIEEKILPKLKHLNSDKVVNPIVFKLNYNDNNVFSYEIDNEILTYIDFKDNVSRLFFLMEGGVIEKFEKKLAEIHKDLMLSM